MFMEQNPFRLGCFYTIVIGARFLVNRREGLFFWAHLCYTFPTWQKLNYLQENPMNIKTYNALVLDMDGTLLDSLEVNERALAETCAAWNIPMTEELLFTILYSSNDHLLELLDARVDGKAFLVDLMENYHSHGHRIKAFPGVQVLIETAVPLGIVTSENRRELASNLARIGFAQERFTGISCAGDTPYLKPHPQPLLHCLEEMGANPATALYVGDSINDFRCAQAAGVAFGLAAWGARNPEDFAGADHIFAAPGEIVPLLKS
jgi:phosphoglycolate phosphatase-like HAD superfamily hydrolase